MPMLGVIRETFEDDEASMSGVEDFFSVARTMPLAALIPREVTPWLTALSAYSGMNVRSYRGSLERFEHTNLHQLAAADELALSFIIHARESPNVPGREGGERE